MRRPRRRRRRRAVVRPGPAPFADLDVVAYGEASLGAAARGLGVLATALGRFEDAAGHFEAAAEANRRMRAAPWLAHTRHDHASMLLARGEPEAAGELAAQAASDFEALGMATWAARARADSAAWAARRRR